METITPPAHPVWDVMTNVAGRRSLALRVGQTGEAIQPLDPELAAAAAAGTAARVSPNHLLVKESLT